MLNVLNSRAKVYKTTLLTHYPQEFCHLNYDIERPWTLLFSVILSAQSTDKTVNMITPKLYNTLPKLIDYTLTPPHIIEDLIYSTGFYRAKTLHIIECAKRLISVYNGVVPDNMHDLLTLSGVGRKTANVVLWILYKKTEGFTVDTHVKKVMTRYGLTHNTRVEAIEQDMMKLFDKDMWGRIPMATVQLGRDFCTARAPKCTMCPMNRGCEKHIQ